MLYFRAVRNKQNSVYLSRETIVRKRRMSFDSADHFRSQAFEEKKRFSSKHSVNGPNIWNLVRLLLHKNTYYHGLFQKTRYLCSLIRLFYFSFFFFCNERKFQISMFNFVEALIEVFNLPTHVLDKIHGEDKNVLLYKYHTGQ